MNIYLYGKNSIIHDLCRFFIDSANSEADRSSLR